MTRTTLSELKTELKPAVKYMGIMIFLLSLGEGMTAPAIPLYGAQIGATYSQLGFLMTGYSISYTLLTISAGRLSDRIGRRNILLAGIIISLIASLGYYFSSSFKLLMLFRVLEGLSRGTIWPISEAIIADNTIGFKRGRAISFFFTAYGAGVIIGTLSGGYIMEYLSLTAVFPLYPVLSLLVFIIVFRGVEDMGEEAVLSRVSADGSSTNYWREIKKIWPVSYIGFAYAGFLYSIWGLLSLVADSFAVSAQSIGYLFALFWGGRLLSFIFSGKLCRVFGEGKTLFWGVVFVLISTGGLLIAGNYLWLALGAIAGGLGTGLIFPVTVILITDKISPGFRGFGTGFLEFSMGIGMIMQTAVSGILGEIKGVQSTFQFNFLVVAAAVLIAYLFISRSEKKAAGDVPPLPESKSRQV